VRKRSFDVWVFAALTVTLSGCISAPLARSIVPLNYLPSLNGDYFALQSGVMNSTYHIYIRYPEAYAQLPEKRYPIIYLLDGDSTFPLLAPEHAFLTYDDHLPDAIVVGIAYGSFASPVNHREIDFGDRAADFQRFLATELIPAVERRTKADPTRRILVGQSFGGTFVLYSAFTQPDLFWARIASNPSPRLHEQLLAGAPPNGPQLNLHLLLVSGTANNSVGRAAALKWGQEWRDKPTPWTFQQIDIPGGTHAADLPNAYRLALRRLFTEER
jgi:hypothetical protein